MKKIKIFLATVLLGMAFTSRAEGDGIKTMLHRGHTVSDFVISYDEKYLLTRSEGEVCVWDLNSRMLLAALPIHTVAIYAHPTDPKLFYADTRMSTADMIKDPTLNVCEVIDWTTGKSVGKVPSDKMPPIYAGSEYTFALNDDRLLLFTAPDKNARPVGAIGGKSPGVRSARSNGNDSLLVTTGLRPCLWDLRHAGLIGPVPSSGPVTEAYFHPRTDELITTGVNRVETGYGKTMPVDSDKIHKLSFYGNDIVALGYEHLFKSVDGKPFYKMPEFRKTGNGRLFTVLSRPYCNGKFLIGGSEAGMRIKFGGTSVFEGSFDSDKPLRAVENKYNKITGIKIAPGDDYAVVTSFFTDVALLDLKTLKYTSALTADYDDLEALSACEILPDGTVVAGTSLGKVIFWKKGQTKSHRRTSDHHAEIRSITLSSDSTKMFTADWNGQITVWDTKTQKPIVYIYQVADETGTDYIFLTPDHYYKATPGISRHINFVKDGQPYAFEQFDLRNNRPDIILSRLGGDPAEVELLHKAWKKRLRRAGVSEESLSDDYHVPTATLNRRNIPLITSECTLPLDVTFADTQYDLSEVTVTVNGVPVLSPDKRRAKGRTCNLSENLALASGNNEISVWCSNVRGASSLRETFNVTYTPQKPVRPDLYIVAAGVSDYADSRYSLGFAAKDAGDFAEALKKRAGQNFANIRTLTLTDKQVMAASIDKIRTFLSASRPDDVALVFFAGHGVLDSELDYYLAAYDMDFADPRKGGIPYDDFMGVFDGVPALNRACFIDACHSGELDKEDYLAVNTVDMPPGEELVFRGAGQAVSAREDVERVNTILADMFRDTRRGVGATVLSSAGGGELAVESPEWNNGLFTYCLLKGIRTGEADADHNGRTSLSEWIDYTRRHVTDMSEGRQSPTLRSQNYHHDLEIK
ncbi:MAG: caspase family protein [Muribaculaceae bacterium]